MPQGTRVWYGAIALVCVGLSILSLLKVEEPLRLKLAEDDLSITDYPVWLMLAALGLVERL